MRTPLGSNEYQPTDQDLPVELFDEPRQPNPVTRAQDRIRLAVAELGISVAAEAIEAFAIILLAIEQTEHDDH